MSLLCVTGVASAFTGISESPWFRGCRFEDQVSMLFGIQTWEKGETFLFPQSNYASGSLKRSSHMSFLSKFVFCWDFFFKHYSVQMLLKFPRATARQLRIKQQLTIFYKSSDIWSWTGPSTAVEQDKESPGLKTTSLFHRCLALSIQIT